MLPTSTIYIHAYKCICRTPIDSYKLENKKQVKFLFTKSIMEQPRDNRTIVKSIICCPEHTKKPKPYYKHLKNDMSITCCKLWNKTPKFLTPKVPIREDVTDFDDNSETQLFSLYSPTTYILQLGFSAFITFYLSSKLFKDSGKLTPGHKDFYDDLKHWKIVYTGVLILLILICLWQCTESYRKLVFAQKYTEMMINKQLPFMQILIFSDGETECKVITRSEAYLLQENSDNFLSKRFDIASDPPPPYSE